MRTLIFVGAAPPLALGATDLLRNWLSFRELAGRYREIGTVNMLARAYDQVYFLTHDDEGDALKYANKLSRNVNVLFRSRSIPNPIYGLMAPLIFRRCLAKANVCRTLQLRGSLIVLVIKCLLGTKLILRQGYQASKFNKKGLSRNSRPFRSHLNYLLTVFLELIFYHVADGIIVSSNADKIYAIKRYRIDASKVFMVPNWIDVDGFKPLPNIPRQKGKVVFVGRLHWQKNIFSLIDAIKGLSGVRLHIIGDGPLRKALEKKIQDEEIDNVVLLGAVLHERLVVELNESEIFVLPSLFEGNPRALLEAMACGLPVIGAKVEGITELIDQGATGLLCSTDSVSIREAVVNLLADNDLRRTLGSNARAFIENNYSVDQILKKELAIHYRLLRP